MKQKNNKPTTNLTTNNQPNKTNKQKKCTQNQNQPTKLKTATTNNKHKSQEYFMVLFRTVILLLKTLFYMKGKLISNLLQKTSTVLIQMFPTQLPEHVSSTIQSLILINANFQVFSILKLSVNIGKVKFQVGWFFLLFHFRLVSQQNRGKAIHFEWAILPFIGKDSHWEGSHWEG